MIDFNEPTIPVVQHADEIRLIFGDIRGFRFLKQKQRAIGAIFNSTDNSKHCWRPVTERPDEMSWVAVAKSSDFAGWDYAHYARVVVVDMVSDVIEAYATEGRPTTTDPRNRALSPPSSALR